MIPLLAALSQTHPHDALARVGSGVLTGGWEYIWVAYVFAWAVFSAYGFSLWVRRPRGDGTENAS